MSIQNFEVFFMHVHYFFDPETSTLTYVVYDEHTNDAVIIDPVLDFDQASGRIEDRSVEKVVTFIKEKGLKPHYILETHAHADHLSSSQLLKQIYPQAKVGISSRIKTVQSTFKDVFMMDELKTDGSDFDFLFEDNKEFCAGSLPILPLPTPGHTPACTSFLIGSNLFSGDALFMPDYGTGRCDFPKGSASQLYDSIAALYELPESTNVFVGHDYQPGGRDLLFQTTIGESKKSNIHLKSSTSREEYIAFREGRDKTLKAPKLLFPSLQANIMAGHLPKKQKNGVSYLQLPLKISLKMGSL
jgi:glyoxylase-like metal-dependent hydrolase (beta-lactamase superfamily II)